MKNVRLKNNIVQEIIPEYALPVEKWYGADFAAQCVEAPDYVEQHWLYNPGTGEFSPPSEPEPEPEPAPTLDERVTTLEQQLAETDEAAIELYEANMAQEAVNAEQDEAIIEIYELIGGNTNG